MPWRADRPLDWKEIYVQTDEATSPPTQQADPERIAEALALLDACETLDDAARERESARTEVLLSSSDRRFSASLNGLYRRHVASTSRCDSHAEALIALAENVRRA